jgi:C-terminal processing protease CtpA/Prc
MLRDTTVDNLLQGTPAYMCGKLRKGDEIVSVDMQLVSPDNVKRLIVGAPSCLIRFA